MTHHATPTFELTFTAPERDVDELGHVSNVAIVRYVQDVAKAHSEAVGLDLAAYQELGAVFVVRRHRIDYLRSIMGGDVVHAKTWITEFKAATADRVVTMEGPDGNALVRAETLWVLVSTTSGRPRRVSPEIVERFRGR